MAKRLAVPLPCMCASLRRASRALTQLYEEALRPHGLRASQFTILQVLALAGEQNQGELGEILSMDSTTLSRTLEIMARRGWIARKRGTDRREWRLSLSPKGHKQLRQALPDWEGVQKQVRGQLGDREWESLMKLNKQVTELARK